MIDKLIEKIQKTGAPIVVGLDPMMKFVPEHIKKTAFAQKGETLEGAAEAVWLFNKEIIDKTYDLIPAVKPQIAMYEQFGIPGLCAFKRTLEYCKEKGLVVIGDVKRGDIGSTSAAYAAAHLGKVQVGSSLCAAFDEDFATVNPYLGSDGVQPFIDVCREQQKGIFVLVKTSNPSSGEFQDRMVSTGTAAGNAGGITFSEQALYELVGMKVEEWAHSSWAGRATAVWARWLARHIPSRERYCARSCRTLLFWCRGMVHRAHLEKTSYTFLMRTVSARSSIHREALSRHIRVRSTARLARSILRMHPDRQCWT